MSNQPYALFSHPHAFSLDLGGQLPHLDLAYETWGELNRAKDNAILVFPGLSASSHAAAHKGNPENGWWETMIGPGLAMDTRHHFVICVNYLGGCFGSTGPSSTNPETKMPYGPQFPPLSLWDIARATQLAIEHLGITQLHAIVGASLGGMMALAYSAKFPDQVKKIVVISASGQAGPQSIAFRYVQRQVILSDPRYANGWYYNKPQRPSAALAVARQIGNITYRSRTEMNNRFGRSETNVGYSFGPQFQIESYLHHMGHKLADHFDANSFLFLTKAMDLFSLGDGTGSYEEGAKRIKAESLIIGVKSDILFPFDEQEHLYKTLHACGLKTRIACLDSEAGHDAFLVEIEYFNDQLKAFLN